MLLGMHWEGHVYVDKTLPFGLRSVPNLLFTAIADALQWVMQQRGVRGLFHYIDDFITIGASLTGAPLTSECKDNVDVMKPIYDETGVPTKPEKDESPTTTIGFLGVELDSIAMEVQLPQAKLEQLATTLATW